MVVCKKAVKKTPYISRRLMVRFDSKPQSCPVLSRKPICWRKQSSRIPPTLRGNKDTIDGLPVALGWLRNSVARTSSRAWFKPWTCCTSRVCCPFRCECCLWVVEWGALPVRERCLFPHLDPILSSAMKLHLTLGSYKPRLCPDYKYSPCSLQLLCLQHIWFLLFYF